MIADRFRIEAVVGSGGMGTVWRAHDVVRDGPVALKMLRESTPSHVERFLREAQVLADFHHPGVSAYVAHGTAPNGEPFLAMEWLEGEDLAGRLRRQGLTPAEAVVTVRAVAVVLEALHARGVVHRDIKPSNIFLLGGQSADVRLLDFGVARLTHGAAVGSTHTGMMLGTPGYMAPEQARGERHIDGRADLFSLGCVLYECLAGQPPFVADHPIAVLAKILLEDAPRLSEVRPGMGVPLEQLVASLLAKEAQQRPADARAVLAALDTLGPLEDTERVAVQPVRKVLTSGERNLCSVVLAGRPDTWARLSSGVTAPPGIDAEAQTQASAVDGTLRGVEPRLRDEIEKLGGTLHFVGDGALVATFSGAGVVTDQVARAGRAALAVRRILPDVPVSLATGRGVVTDQWPLGEVIDRAAALLAGAGAQGPGQGTRIDQLTAGLLGSRFLCEGDGNRFRLIGEVPSGPTAARQLLGRTMPFVGRERELDRLVGLVEESIDEPAARVALVVAPPGVGKSRLRDQMLARLSETQPTLAVWTARGDPVRLGSSFFLAGQLLRSASQMGEEANAESIWAGLSTWTKQLPLVDRPRVLAFLGELVGGTGVESQHVQLLEAKLDPALMADQVRRAWDEVLAAVVEERPVLLVLDDVHWGDLPTLRLIDGSLRRLGEAAFSVVAFARPSVHDVFPGLWKERGIEETRLRELSRKASLQLAKAGLGEGATVDIDRLVSLSDGNPLHLEELIRASSQGRASDLPATVVAMFESRLEALALPLRRALRAGAIFGSRFARDGVAHLLGEAPEHLDPVLRELAEKELLERQTEVAGGSTTFAFRHALVREAALAMLTEADATLGNRLAGEWLETGGERDPLVLADHFVKGGERARAATHLVRAADDALTANDLAAAAERARRGIALGATGETLGELHRVQAEAAAWLSDTEGAWAQASAALQHCPRDSESWYRAATVAAQSASRLARVEPITALAREMLTPLRAEAAPAPFVVSAVRVSWSLYTTGQSEVANRLLTRAEEIGATIREVPRVHAALQVAGATRTMLAGELEAWMQFEGTSADAFAAMGDIRRACEALSTQGYALNSLGAYAEAAVILNRAIVEAEALGIFAIRAIAEQNLGWAMARTGKLAEGLEHLTRCSESYRASRDHRLEGGTRIYLAQFQIEAGRLDAGTAELDRADALLGPFPPLRVLALAVRVAERLARGLNAEAAAVVEKLQALVAQVGFIEEGESYVHWVRAASALANGQVERSREIAGEALARIQEQAGRIQSPALRASFLDGVLEHRRLAELASSS